MQRFVTTNSKEKVEIKKEYFGEDNILIANLTETWLDSTIKDVVEIEGYNIFRGDRKRREGESQDREGGGTAIYLHEKLEANQISEFSNGVCDMVAVMIPEIQTVNIVVYRPPKTKSSEFNPILKEIQKIFKNLEKPDPTIILSGDFNFPFVKWKRMSDNSCIWEYKTYANATKDEKDQFEKLLSICNNQFMLQIIEEPTREENTLDLIFTNEMSLITKIEVNKTNYSDHNIIEVSTNYTITEHSKNLLKDTNSIMQSLNFRARSVNWVDMGKEFNDSNWEEKSESTDTIQLCEEIIELLENSAKENAPKRGKKGNKSRIPREKKTS